MSELRFTYAGLENYPGDNDRAALLFHHPDIGVDEHLLKSIAVDSTFRELFRGVPVVLSPTGQEDTVIASPDLSSEVFSIMETSGVSNSILLVGPSGKTENINLYNTYYGCTLPHKLIVGCVDCYLGGPNPRDCRLKQLAYEGKEKTESDRPTLEEMRTSLTSRKTRIANFTFVSPRLTAEKAFAPAYRKPDEHDFNQVDYRTSCISKGAKERERRRRFKKQECARCLTKDECHRYRPDHEVSHCDGPFLMTGEEAVGEILHQVTIPYSSKELAQCLSACGQIKKRFHGAIHYATFAVQGRILAFGMRRLHQPHVFIPLLPGKKLHQVLDEYCYYSPSTTSADLTGEDKAILCELAAITTSPVKGAGWHKTSYPAIYIEHRWVRTEKFILHFRYNSGRRGILPWSLKVGGIKDIFANYGGFVYLDRALSPIHRYAFHSSAYQRRPPNDASRF